MALPAVEMDGLLELHHSVLRHNLILSCKVLLCLFCIFSSTMKPQTWAPSCKMLHQHTVK